MPKLRQIGTRLRIWNYHATGSADVACGRLAGESWSKQQYLSNYYAGRLHYCLASTLEHKDTPRHVG